MRMWSSALLGLFAGLILATQPLAAKGLNEVSPEVEGTEAESTDDTPPPPADEVEAKGEEGKQEEPAMPTDVKPSESALKLTDKIYLGLNFGFVRASASEGDWTAGSSGGLTAGYRIHESLVLNSPLYLTGQYAPINVTVKNKSQSYRGVLESYLVGAMIPYQFKPNLRFIGTAELGLVSGSYRSSLKYDNPTPPEDSGFLMQLGGGASWLVLERIYVGPRLHLGFGTFQVTQLNLSAEFYF